MLFDSPFYIFRSVVVLALLLIVAAICVSDQRSRRIPNNLVLAGLAIALLFHTVAPSGYGMFDRFAPGAIGLGRALLGAAICFVVFFALYLIRAMGAGDVKLMAMFGALFGPAQAFGFIVLVFLCGGALALIRLADAERRARLVSNMRLMFLHRLAGPAGDAEGGFDPVRDTADRMPFAIAIATAAVVLAWRTDQGYGLPWSLALF